MSEIRRMLQDPDCVLAESLGDLQYLKDKYTINGKPTIVKSPFGNAMNFVPGRSEKITLGTLDKLNFGTGDFTLACCVYIATYTTFHTMFSKRASGGVGYRFYIYQTTGVIVLDTNDGALASGIGAQVPLNGWHHLAGTRTGAIGAIYMDGIDVTSSGVLKAGDLDVPATPAIIGAFNATQYMNGSLPYMLAWKRLLSPTEILNIATGKAF